MLPSNPLRPGHRICFDLLWVKTPKRRLTITMTPRQQRRREEHKARKEAYKAQKQTESQAEKLPKTEGESVTESPVRADVHRALVNKQNAQHSTGPRTEAGKLVSSRNSFKHGLYSRKLVIQGEDRADLDALRDDLRREHQPANTTEEILVNELAENYWRLRRMRRYETRVMASETAEEFAQKMSLLPLIQRTMVSAERAFHKALATLRQLQKERIDNAAPIARESKMPHGFVPQTGSNPETPCPTITNPVLENAAPATRELDLGFVPQNERSSTVSSSPCALEISRKIAA